MGEDFPWKGRGCKIYTKMPTDEWKIILQEKRTQCYHIEGCHLWIKFRQPRLSRCEKLELDDEHLLQDMWKKARGYGSMHQVWQRHTLWLC